MNLGGPNYETVLVPLKLVNRDPWSAFKLFAFVQYLRGWPALEVFSHHVEYLGVRVTVRRVG